MEDIKPLTFEEYKEKVIKLFLERGTTIDDLKHVQFLIDKYESKLAFYNEGKHNTFSDKILHPDIVRAGRYAKVEKTTFPMSKEEFKHKLIELSLKGYESPCTEDEKKYRLECFEKMHEVVPDWLEKDYWRSCYEYVAIKEGGGQAAYAFSDEYILSHQVSLLELCDFYF